ncbi:MAG: nickel pincer cofactor biosynthesis protein LarB [Nitrososphaerales archaeon]
MGIREILDKLLKGEISLEEAEKRIRLNYLEELEGSLKFDVNRELRKGFPEIVLAMGKSFEQLIRIAKKVLEREDRVIISRVDEDSYRKMEKTLNLEELNLKYNDKARVLVIRKKGFEVKPKDRKIAIISAGTSDIPIAEEAKVIVEEMGFEALCFYDVGVGGLHRLFKPLKEIIEKDCDVVIVVAGMEGALPSVVSGLIDLPVIGVPTSIGYGFGSRGKSALLSMLQSCSPGLAVVNIDNGVGAGAFASLIANKIQKVVMRTKNEGN